MSSRITRDSDRQGGSLLWTVYYIGLRQRILPALKMRDMKTARDEMTAVNTDKVINEVGLSNKLSIGSSLSVFLALSKESNSTNAEHHFNKTRTWTC